MGCVLRTDALTKEYDGIPVVNKVSLSLYKGEIYGLLGKNGAGKTTFMKMIMGLIESTKGKIELFDKPLIGNTNILNKVGMIIETPVFYDSLSAEENLKLHCRYKNIDYSLIPDCLRRVGIYESRKKKVKEFSLGMKQRLGIARAIIGNPKLLVLDEPINGLDPEGIKDMRELLVGLVTKDKITILISSHILSEIESIAHRIGFMDCGTLVKEINMYDFKHQSTKRYEIFLENLTQDISKINRNFEILERRTNSVIVDVAGNTLMGVTKILLDNNIQYTNIKNRHESLEEYFVQILDRGNLDDKSIKN